MMSIESGAAVRHLVKAAALASSVLLLATLGACDGDRPAREDISVEAALALLDEPDRPLFLDVRSESEYARGHIEGSLNVPHTEVAARMDEIRATGKNEVIVYCERGGRARVAEAALAEAGGYDVQHMEGDMRAWRRFELPVVRGLQ